MKACILDSVPSPSVRVAERFDFALSISIFSDFAGVGEVAWVAVSSSGVIVTGTSPDADGGLLDFPYRRRS